eukprot:355774-Rhodomonas_salina.1
MWKLMGLLHCRCSRSLRRHCLSFPRTSPARWCRAPPLQCTAHRRRQSASAPGEAREGGLCTSSQP